VKVVILAGGLGTRIAEETEVRPKPMIEIGGRPILWHIMKHMAHHGLNEFVVALGYKGEFIKRYFLDFFEMQGSLTINGAAGTVQQKGTREDWTVHLVETGASANTGGRLRRLKTVLGNEPFMVTYGDGVSDVDPNAVIDLHRKSGCLATVTAVRPPARFGGLFFQGDLVERFTEKPQAGEGWINGGYIVLQPEVLDRIPADDSSLEAEILEQLAKEHQLAAYRHAGFWQCMDTLRDKRFLESLWGTNKAPWCQWKDAA
jgi:glucose-1-phosphate cytidylyltransferase